MIHRSANWKRNINKETPWCTPVRDYTIMHRLRGLSHQIYCKWFRLKSWQMIHPIIQLGADSKMLKILKTMRALTMSPMLSHPFSLLIRWMVKLNGNLNLIEVWPFRNLFCKLRANKDMLLSLQVLFSICSRSETIFSLQNWLLITLVKRHSKASSQPNIAIQFSK